MIHLIEPWKIAVLTIIQEASSEPLEGQIAVAEVIRNRTKTKYNSNGTLVDTCLRNYQFSGWSDTNRVRALSYSIESPIVTNAIRAYRAAFEGESQIVGNANLYHATYMNPFPKWALADNVEPIKIIGRHKFYFEKR